MTSLQFKNYVVHVHYLAETSEPARVFLDELLVKMDEYGQRQALPIKDWILAGICVGCFQGVVACPSYRGEMCYPWHTFYHGVAVYWMGHSDD